MPTVLVVDDNPIVLRMLVDLLKADGIDAIAASNAEHCVDVLRYARPDAIVLDMQLPGKDGFTLARELKGDARTRAIPIVAVTSYAMQGDEDRAKAAGCDGYLAKPVDTRTFSSVIRGYCETAARSSEPSLRIL